MIFYRGSSGSPVLAGALFAQVTVCMLLLTLLIINIVTWPVIQSNASFLPGTVQKLEATVF